MRSCEYVRRKIYRPSPESIQVKFSCHFDVWQLTSANSKRCTMHHNALLLRHRLSGLLVLLHRENISFANYARSCYKLNTASKPSTMIIVSVCLKLMASHQQDILSKHCVGLFYVFALFLFSHVSRSWGALHCRGADSSDGLWIFQEILALAGYSESANLNSLVSCRFMSTPLP